MSTLVLELRQGDMMIVNGAPIRFRNRARIELTAKARFLFGKQLTALLYVRRDPFWRITPHLCLSTHGATLAETPTGYRSARCQVFPLYSKCA